MLDLGRLDQAALPDRGVGADVGVDQPCSRADDRGPAHGRALDPRARLDDDATVELRVLDHAVAARLERVEDQPVGLEHVGELAGVLPPALHDVGLDAHAPVDHVLDRVGDLELAARARRDRASRLVDGGGEHVDADERKVAAGCLRLLDEAHDAVAVELGDAVVLRIRHRREQDQRVALAASEALDQLDDPALQEVVAEVHHERLIAEEGLGRQHGVGEAGRRLLEDVGDLDAEARSVAGGGADLLAGLGRDDDADLLDARGRDRLDPVEEHGLVGDRDQLLGARVRDRAQPRALAAGEDQALHAASSLR